MKGINLAIIIGTLGTDPDIKYAANGNAIANLSVATSEEWIDKNSGQKQQKTEWHKVSIFGPLAKVAGQYLTKGSQVYLEGKIQTRKWQDQTGQDRYTTEIVLSGYNAKMQMLGGGQVQQKGQSIQPGQPPQPQAQPSRDYLNPDGSPMNPQQVKHFPSGQR